jgi:transcriptional regulator with XRE-family HTH domain
MIVEKVKQEMDRQSVSITDLADRSGITRTALSRWLNGHTAMKTTSLEKVIAELGIKFERGGNRRHQ